MLFYIVVVDCCCLVYCDMSVVYDRRQTTQLCDSSPLTCQSLWEWSALSPHRLFPHTFL